MVDVDTRSDGLQNWEQLVQLHGELPPTCEALTGSGGCHLYWICPDDTIGNSRGALAPGIDVRGNGGHIVLPPAPHPSGGEYSWVNPPWDTPPAEAPSWLLDVVKSKPKPTFKELGDLWEPGEQEEHVWHHGYEWGLKGGDPNVIISVVINKFRQGDIPNTPDREPWTEDQLKVKVISAWEEGSLKRQKVRDGTLSLVPSDPPEPDAEDLAYDGELIPDRYLMQHGLSETDNAIRFSRLVRGDAFYVEGLGWYIWDGRRWVYDLENLRIMGLAKRVGKEVQQEAMNEPDSSARVSMLKWAVQCENRNRQDNMIHMSRIYLQIKLERLDADIWSLNLQNGTLDIRSNSLFPHQRNKLITKLAPVTWDPDAVAPRWSETLQYAFSAEWELRDFFQRGLGYSLTGSTGQRCIFICWGESGKNGKSSLLEGFRRLMGPDYAGTATPQTILGTQQDNTSMAILANLRGARYVEMSEVSDKALLNEALVKLLTGGDAVTARRLYKDPMSYVPHFKLWLRTNERPTIKGSGDPIWDRIKLIPFEQQIPVAVRRDFQDLMDEFTAEAPGILNWALAGYRMFRDSRGLADPAAIKAAVQDYRSEMDLVLEALTARCDFGPGHESNTSHLYNLYKGYLIDGGMSRSVMTPKKFTRRLRTLGRGVDVTDSKSRGGWKVLGIAPAGMEAPYEEIPI